MKGDTRPSSESLGPKYKENEQSSDGGGNTGVIREVRGGVLHCHRL